MILNLAPTTRGAQRVGVLLGLNLRYPILHVTGGMRKVDVTVDPSCYDDSISIGLVL